jgi:hypothetical protein
MRWLNIETAPFERDLEVAVIDFYGPHPVVFLGRRIPGGWIKADSGRSVQVRPTHWREWITRHKGPPHEKAAA